LSQPPDSLDPLLGQSLGEFEILALLGRGGMGAVYKARQASLDRLVAIKVLPQEYADDANFLERFSREARAAAAINHPNIVQVFSVGQDKGHDFIAMEFVDGESLADVLKREGRLPAYPLSLRERAGVRAPELRRRSIPRSPHPPLSQRERDWGRRERAGGAGHRGPVAPQ
jgi:serine/threonine protein kinase